MFMELMPLLKRRTVMLALARIDDQLMRVNVIPYRTAGSESDDNPALTTPLSVTGTPEELDREMPAQLSAFVESVIKTGSNLDELREQHQAAIKALDAENRKKLAEKRKGSGNGKEPPPAKEAVAAEFKEGKPVFGTKPVTNAPQAPSLFDGPDAAPAASECAPPDCTSSGQGT